MLIARSDQYKKIIHRLLHLSR